MTYKFITLNDIVVEKVISRSRFITLVRYVENEDDAFNKLNAIKKQYSDATHVCYGFIADPDGLTVRFSDAGEPSGTAGQPIIETIKGADYRKVLVAVVRYFGGIKLGVGGLKRAYCDCTVEALANATKIQYVFCAVYKFKADFSLFRKIVTHLNATGKILSCEYGTDVDIEYAAPIHFNFADFLKNSSQGKVEAQKINEKYIALDSIN